MKIIMYGTEICPDCVAAKAQLGELTAVELDYRNITGNTATLKEFLRHRDHDEMFQPVKEEGRIGIPPLFWKMEPRPLISLILWMMSNPNQFQMPVPLTEKGAE